MQDHFSKTLRRRASMRLPRSGIRAQDDRRNLVKPASERRIKSVIGNVSGLAGKEPQHELLVNPHQNNAAL